MAFRRIQSDSHAFHVLDDGNGPPLLFVHGFPLDHTMWRSQIEEFSPSWRVIAPDLRGFGNSDVVGETATMELMADDLAGICEALGVHQPVTFCGLSMGGYVAWQFYLRHREKLGRLILCDTKAAADPPEARQARYDTADRVLTEGPEFLAAGMPEKLFAAGTRQNRPDVVNQTQQVIRRGDPRGIAAALRGMAARPDVGDQLSGIDLPTLLIVGEEDAISPPSEMQAMAEAIPDAVFVQIPSAGHMAPLESPRQVNAAIRRFLSDG